MLERPLIINVGNNSDYESESESETEDTTLSYTTRVLGYIVCTLLGYFCTFLSTHFIHDIYKNSSNFAILYTLGNVLSLTGSLVLYGNPCRDFLIMFKKKHIFPTLVYFISMFLTFYFAYTKHITSVYIFITLQFLANLCLSYTYLPDYIKQYICPCIW